MSDSDSLDFSSERHSHIRRTLSDFPLSTSAFATSTRRDLDRLLTRLELLDRQASRLNLSARTARSVTPQPPAGFDFMPSSLTYTDRRALPSYSIDPEHSPAMSNPIIQRQLLEAQTQRRNMEPEGNNANEPEKPILTLVPTLPETVYKDKDDSKGTAKTLAYVKAQRAVLKYLESQPSDSLNPHQACKWTQAIDPIGKEPKAEEALRLCYYMRSQGYDTGAIIGDKVMQLYVINLHLGINKKLFFWKQNFSTNAVEYMAQTGGRTSRRNAVPNLQYLDSMLPPAEGFEVGQTIAAHRAAALVEQRVAQNAQTQTQTQPQTQTQTRTQTQTQTQSRTQIQTQTQTQAQTQAYADAEVRLNDELAREYPNPE